MTSIRSGDVAGLLALRCIDAIGFGALLTLGPILALRLGAGTTAATWLSMLYSFCFIVGAMLIGRVSARYGARRTILFAVALSLSAALLLVLSQSLSALILNRILSGFGSASVVPAGALLLNYGDSKSRIHARQLAFTVGVAVGAGLSILASRLGNTEVFICLAALFGVALVIAFSLSEAEGETIARVLAEPDRAATGKSVSSRLVLATFAAFLAYSMIFTALPLILFSAFVDGASFDYNRGVALAGIASAVSMAAALVAQTAIAPFVARAVQQWNIARFIVLAWAINLAVAPLLLQVGYRPFLVTVAISGLLSSLIFPVLLSLLVNVMGPQARGSAVSSSETAIGFASIAGPLISGPLVAVGPTYPYLGALIAMLATFAILWSAARSRASEPPEPKAGKA